MVKSMTGYGRAEAVFDGITVSIEIKSVNHRYFEFNLRIPHSAAFLEDKLRRKVQESIARGKVDMFVSFDANALGSVDIAINEKYAEAYIAALRRLNDKFGLRDDISVSSVARNQDIFTVNKELPDEDYLWNCLSSVADDALNAFVYMRGAEGARLEADVKEKMADIMKLVEFIEQRSPGVVEDYRERLRQKMLELLEDKQVDEQRLITETAIFADKVAVNEETVRLRSHMHQVETLLSSDEPIGRKLDFIVQEMNREANTIGSKAQDIEIAHAVVNIKSEIEKIREQIQNIE